MDKPAIVYRPRPNVTPEREPDALAAVYSFVLQTGREKKEGARTVLCWERIAPCELVED